MAAASCKNKDHFRPFEEVKRLSRTSTEIIAAYSHHDERWLIKNPNKILEASNATSKTIAETALTAVSSYFLLSFVGQIPNHIQKNVQQHDQQ